MTKIKNILVIMIGIVGILLYSTKLQATDSLRIEAESSQVVRHSAIKIVDDGDASGGKAIEIPNEINTNENIVTFNLPPTISAGHYQVLLRLKVKDIYDLGKALRIEIREGTTLKKYAVAYGLYLKGKSGYQDFAVDYDLRDTTKQSTILMHWTSGVGYGPGYGGNPNIRIDRCDFVRIDDLPAVAITNVSPDRIRYLVDQDGDVSITLKNFSLQEQHGELKVEVTHDLEDARPLGNQIVNLGPGQSKEVKFPLKHGGGLFGYAVTATLLQDNKVIDKAEEYFTVHNSHFAVATGLGVGSRDDESTGGLFNGTWHHRFFQSGYTDAEIQVATDASRVERDYTTSMELGRLPGEYFYMAPKEPLWIDSTEQSTSSAALKSKREMQKAIAGLKQYGIGCHAYLFFMATGLPAIEMIREHPDWFVYSDVTSDHEQWYNTANAMEQKRFWENFDWKKFGAINPESPTWKGTDSEWVEYQKYTQALATEIRKLGSVGYFLPNNKLPEVMDYVIDQIIVSTRMFGWDGIRWDGIPGTTFNFWEVTSLGKPNIDFYGQPLAKTTEEAIEQTIVNIKRLKAGVWKEFPNFVFGYNFGSWEEMNRFPKFTEELCRDGGWMLNEWSNWYNSPTSPYHSWDKYYAIHSDTGEYITSRGGHYNPFSGSWAYPADRLYGTIFMLSGKGHPHVLHYNSRTPAGNFAQFCVRFGGFIFDPNLRRLNKPERYVSVKSSSPLLWEKSVQRLIEDKKEYWIIHLINSPVTKEIETDPTNRLPEPVSNTMVSVRLPEGKSKVKAWALTAESWKFGDKPKPQAIPLEVKLENNQTTVTMPQILYWKMVVFQFE